MSLKEYLTLWWTPDKGQVFPPKQENEDPPLTKDFLIKALENQLKMREFADFCDYGSPTHRSYFDGMRDSTQYLLKRLREEKIKE